MLDHVTSQVSTYFWRAIVVIIGGAMFLMSLVVSFGILFELRPVWLTLAILSVLVFWGVSLLLGPIVLLMAILIMPTVVPVASLAGRLWQWVDWGYLLRRAIEVPKEIFLSPQLDHDKEKLV